MGVVYDHMNETNFAGLAEHEEMLSDSVRVDAYHRGIHRNVRPGDVVLDLGTGTGLLGVHGQHEPEPRRSTPSNTPTSSRSRARSPSTTASRTSSSCRPTAASSLPPEPIDVVLHEQMGDELFNENMLQNVLDLRDRVLRGPAGAFCPPRSGSLPSRSPSTSRCGSGASGTSTCPTASTSAPPSTPPSPGRFDTGRNDQFWAPPGVGGVHHRRSHEPVLEFDLHTLQSLDALGTDHLIERTASADAIVDGCCIWFEARIRRRHDPDDEPPRTAHQLGQPGLPSRPAHRSPATSSAVNLRMGQLFEPSTWHLDSLSNS